MARNKKRLIQVIDFFSGCGGMSYGFASAECRNTEYKILGGVDTDPHANATYERMLGVAPIQADIRGLLKGRRLDDAVKQWGLRRNRPLLVIGCAPCQGFSSHQKRYSKATDHRNSLLSAFAKITLRLAPDLVIMENVPEIFSVKHWKHFDSWHRVLSRKGYAIRARIYNLAQFGVPQERFRALVIAAKRWRFFRMPKPSHSPNEFITARQAIDHLPQLAAGESDPSDPMHITSRHRPETVNLLQHIPPDGGSQRDLPDGIGPECIRRVDGFRDIYGRLWWDRPANAITARCRTPSAGRYAHPEQHRGLSVREAALLQGFPEDYFFEGPFDDKFKQVGNAVSPTFAGMLALHIDSEWGANHTRPVNTTGDVVEPFRKSFSSTIASLKRRMRNGKLNAIVPLRENA